MANPIVTLFVESGQKWVEDRAARLAAALAYYTLFSLAPLLIILTGIISRLLNQAIDADALPGLIEQVLGPNVAEWLLGLANGTQLFDDSSSFTIAAIISFGVIFWGAANIFNHLKETLNIIWRVRVAPGKQGIIANVRGRLLAFATVIGSGLLIVVFFVLNTLVATIVPLIEDLIFSAPILNELFPEAVETFTNQILPAWRVIQIVQFILAFALATVVFTLFYKILPDVQIAWRDVWIGGAFTALMISIGTFGLTIYFRISSLGSLYGAAGTIMVVLFFIYYSAQIFLFGAEFTYVYANHFGSKIRPSNRALAVEIYFDQPTVVNNPRAPEDIQPGEQAHIEGNS